jgi:glycosyltransferase involved in cell wall biosynthesis
MTANKGQADLLQAFAARFQGDPTVQLRIGGDGPLRAELQTLALELGISEQVTFLGMLSREQVATEMQRADAFVLSSHYETFGVVLIEALACGTPIIATACGGPECIVRPSNGLLVPPGDVDALGAAMAQIRETSANYPPDALHSECMAQFGEQAVAAQLGQIYQSVLREPA